MFTKLHLYCQLNWITYLRKTLVTFFSPSFSFLFLSFYFFLFFKMWARCVLSWWRNGKALLKRTSPVADNPQLHIYSDFFTIWMLFDLFNLHAATNDPGCTRETCLSAQGTLLKEQIMTPSNSLLKCSQIDGAAEHSFVLALWVSEFSCSFYYLSIYLHLIWLKGGQSETFCYQLFKIEPYLRRIT